VGVSCLRLNTRYKKAKARSYGKQMCVFGFTEDSDACRLLNLGTNSIIKARDAEFFEKDLSLKGVPENT